MNLNFVKHDSEAAWLAARRRGIGSSEIGAVCGLSRFASPWSVWRRKVEGDDSFQRNSAMEAGHRLEPVIPGWFRDLCTDPFLDGTETEDPGDYALLWSPDHPIAYSTLDRLLTRDGAPVAVLELKTAFYDQAREFHKRFPHAYRAQVQWQMMCSGLKTAYFAVLCGGIDLLWFKEDYHERFVDSMLRKAESFWKLVESRTPPPADYTEATSRAIAEYYDDIDPAAITLPAELADVADRIEHWNSIKKEAARNIEGQKNKVKAALGNHEAGRAGDVEYTWKKAKDGSRRFKSRHLGEMESAKQS